MTGVQRTIWQSGDYAWIAIVASVVVYELIADDLLSEASERYCAAHPVLTRLLIFAVAGHLAVLLPPIVDVFSAKNIIHRAFVAASHIDRSKSGSGQVYGAKRGAHQQPQGAPGQP